MVTYMKIEIATGGLLARNDGEKEVKECVSAVQKDENNIVGSFKRTSHGPYQVAFVFPFLFTLLTYVH